MRAFPHHYTVTALGTPDGDVELRSPGVTALQSASPAEFGGPGNRWSPETLVTAAVGDCLILTFRAIARASRLRWTSLECDVTGILDRLERTPEFVRFDILARLTLPPGSDPDAARQAVEAAERKCLIANSLKAIVHLTTSIETSNVEVEPDVVLA